MVYARLKFTCTTRTIFEIEILFLYEATYRRQNSQPAATARARGNEKPPYSHASPTAPQ